jgi:hypothetical protein
MDPESWGRNLLSLGIFTMGNLMLRQEVYGRLGQRIVCSKP